jgi:AcrR family transcriptional regulator
MTTRDRILLTTLALFNEEGVAKVSTNRIATELDMSPGNLYYHFKSKEQLVDWLFRRLENDLKPFTESGVSLSALDDVWLALHLAFEVIEKYRFLYTDIDYLIREYPRFGERIQAMTLTTMETVRTMCRNLSQTGVIRASNEEIDNLAFQIVFTATCWSTFTKLIALKDAKTSAPALAAYHVLTLMSPYLADDARHYMNYLRSKYLK